MPGFARMSAADYNDLVKSGRIGSKGGRGRFQTAGAVVAGAAFGRMTSADYNEFLKSGSSPASAEPEKRQNKFGQKLNKKLKRFPMNPT